MKLRSDYVSNSSSSSFIIIVDSGADLTDRIKEDFARYSDSWNAYEIPSQSYKHQFGWEWENTTSIGGKLNFIGIQLLNLLSMKICPNRYYRGDASKEFDRCYDMLKKVCQERFGFNISLREDLINVGTYHGDDGYEVSAFLDHEYYIDHQSCVTENQNMDMFESEDKLYNFLRYEGSQIEGGNDNEPKDGYEEEF